MRINLSAALVFVLCVTAAAQVPQAPPNAGKVREVIGRLKDALRKS